MKLGSKTCPTCHIEKDITEYKKLKWNDQSGKIGIHDDGTGYAIRCKACTRQDNLERQRQWRERNKEKQAAKRKAAREVRRITAHDMVPWPATTSL